MSKATALNHGACLHFCMASKPILRTQTSERIPQCNVREGVSPPVRYPELARHHTSRIATWLGAAWIDSATSLPRMPVYTDDTPKHQHVCKGNRSPRQPIGVPVGKPVSNPHHTFNLMNFPWVGHPW